MEGADAVADLLGRSAVKPSGHEHPVLMSVPSPRPAPCPITRDNACRSPGNAAFAHVRAVLTRLVESSWRSLDRQHMGREIVADRAASRKPEPWTRGACCNAGGTLRPHLPAVGRADHGGASVVFSDECVDLAQLGRSVVAVASSSAG